MRVGMWTIALGLGLALAAGGCIPRQTAQPTGGAIPQATAGDFSVVAVPVYRLVTSPALLDAPSRLMVVQVRIVSTGNSGYAFTPGDLTVKLPDGTHARIFDRARADELLRRTFLAEADMNYLLRPDHLPGGVGEYSPSALVAMI